MKLPATRKKRGQVTAETTQAQFEAFTKAIKQGQMTTTTASNFQWIPAKEEPTAMARGGWDKDTQEIVTMILAGLCKQAGGQLVLTEDELADKGDQIYLDINERAGLVTVVLIPEYVKIGHEDKPISDKVAETLQGADGPIRFGDTAKSIQFYVDGSPLTLTPLTADPPSTVSGTFKSSGAWTFDEIK